MKTKNKIMNLFQRGLAQPQEHLKRLNKHPLAKPIGFLVIALIITLSITATFALPQATWIATSSNNCLAQGTGNTMVEVNGKIYVLFGGSTSFKRYEPAGISGGTGDCEVANLAAAPVTISDGATMEKVDNNTIYVFPGDDNGTEIYIYLINHDTWITSNRGRSGDSLTAAPIPQHSSSIQQLEGSNVVGVDNLIYTLSGGLSNTFFKYNPSSNTWTQLTNAPGTVTTGSAMTGVGNTTDIYVLRGNSTITANNFWRYNIGSNTWTTLANVPIIKPVLPSGSEAFGAGADLVYPGTGDYIYAFGGNNTRSFYRYCFQNTGSGCTTNTWDNTIEQAPDLVREGGSLAYPGSGNYVYAFQGNNSNNFWRYDLVGDNWETLDDAPNVVGNGGSLIGKSGNIYAVPGKNTRDFWVYNTTTNDWTVFDSTKILPVQEGVNTFTNEARGGLAVIDNGASGGTEIFMIPGNGGGSSNIGSLFRYPLSGSNANTWVTYQTPPRLTNAQFGVGTAFSYPGVSAQDPTGDYLYILAGGGFNAAPFWKYSLSKNDWFMWNRSNLTVGANSNIPLSQLGDLNSSYYQGAGNTSVEVNDFIYVLEGQNSTTNRRFDRFDPTTNSWKRLSDAPADIGSGAALTKYDNNTIYALGGNSTRNFYRYDIPSNSWITFNLGTLEDGTVISQDGSSQGYGNSAVEINDEIYVIASSNDFNKYNPANNTWTRLANYPSTFYTAEHFSMVGVGTDIYLSMGDSGRCLTKYNTLNDTWTPCETGSGTPTGSLSRPPASPYSGSQLVYDGSNYLYLVRGSTYFNYTKNFYRYDIAGNTWTTMADAPEITAGGGDAVYLGGYIYALAGGNTNKFWRYNTTNDTWAIISTPAPDSVVSGGSLTTDGTYLYATKGGKTKTFWRYEITNPGDGSGIWTNLSDAPARIGEITSGGIPISNRGGITFRDPDNTPNNGDEEIWLVTSNGLNGFNQPNDTDTGGLIFRYKIQTDEWPVMEKASTPPIEVYTGGSLSYPGTGNVIYAMRGNSTTEFWGYNVVSNTWYAFTKGLSDTPTPLSTDTRDQTVSPATYAYQQPGNTFTETLGNLYFLGLGETSGIVKEFRKYSTSTDTWSLESDTPASIGSGANITTKDSDTLYAFRGANSDNFWRYDTSSQVWIPYNIANNNSEPIPQNGTTQGNGNTIAQVNDVFYVITGNSSGNSFESYNPATNTWSPLPNFFLNSFGNGASMVAVGTDLYVAIGGGSSTFGKYDTLTREWTTLSNFANPSMNAGAAMAYKGSGDFIYVLTGGNSNSFRRYSISGNSWTTLGNTPATVQGGGALTFVGDDIYALGGNGTTNFWKYDSTQATPGTWDSLTGNSIPKEVYSGGALTSDGTYVYATNGGFDKFFWRYDPSGTSGDRWRIMENLPAKMGNRSSQTSQARGGITYYDPDGTPANGDEEIWAVTGKGRKTYETDSFDSETFGSYDQETGGLLFKYDITSNTWPIYERTEPAPAGVQNGALTYPGTGDLLYAFGASFSNALWTYNTVQNEWNAFTKSKLDSGSSNRALSQRGATQGNGNTMVEVNGIFYVFAGNSTTTFESYDPVNNLWKKLPPVPANTTSGAALVKFDNNTIFAFIGGSTSYYKYSIPIGKWTAMASAPASVAEGGSLAYPGSGDYIYGFRGGNNNTFWEYCVQNTGSGCTVDTWTALANAPANVVGGGALTGINLSGTNYIYAFPGNSNNFYRFDTGAGTWSAALASPGWVGNTGSGASLTNDGTTYIYASRGNGSTDIARYDTSGGTWSNLNAFPVNIGTASTSSAKGGLSYVASGPSGGAEIYGLSGNGITGNTTSSAGLIYRHPFTGGNANTWPTLAVASTTPSTYGTGASLTGSLNGANPILYALRGNSNSDFWRYNITDTTTGAGSWTALTSIPGSTAVWGGGALTIKPTNPTYPTIYAVKGNSSKDFYKYDVSDASGNGSWTALNDTPMSLNSNFDTRGGLAYSSTTDEVYESPGFGISESSAPTNSSYYTGILYRYPLTGANANTWPVSTSPSATPSTIGSGGSLTGLANILYGLRGGSSNTFWRYNITDTDTGAGSWTALTSMPGGTTVNGGGSLTIRPTNPTYPTIYATKGNNTNELYKFDVSNASGDGAWTALATAPTSIGTSFSDQGQVVYGNTGGTHSLWLVTGNGINGYNDQQGSTVYTGLMYRYDIGSDNWPIFYESADLPSSLNTFFAGSDITSTPDALKIYALRGTNTTPTTPNPNFWRYDISGSGKGSWTALTNLPNNTSPVNIQAGGSVQAIDNNLIYALQGAGTTNFLRYNIGTDTWATQSAFPTSVGEATISEDRGDLVYVPTYSALYATSGNDTTSPFTIYTYPITRAVITNVEKTGGGTPVAGQSIDVTVETVDAQDNPYNVAANTDITLTLKTGVGIIGGTVTGQITSGNNSVIISGLTYSVPDGGVVLTASDTTNPANLITLAPSDSDPFTVDSAAPDLTSLNIITGPTAGTTGATLTGNNFYTHYNKTVTITNSGSSLTDYQQLVTFNTKELIDGGKMRSDCADIRFTSNVATLPYSADTQLNYWLESGCNTPETKVWVKVPSIAASPTLTTIYLNYGDFRLSSLSDAENTFEFFDDFSGTTIDTGKWTVNNSNNAITQNDRLYFNFPFADSGIYSVSNFSRAGSHLVEFEMTSTSSNTFYDALMGWKNTTVNTTTASMLHAMNLNGNNSSDDVYESGSSFDSTNSQFWLDNATYLLKVILDPSNGAIYSRSTDNGNTQIQWYSSSSDSTASAKVAIVIPSFNAQQFSIDNLRVRKYAVSEPTAAVENESPTLEVNFGSNPASILSITDTQIKVVTPSAASIGSVNVTVTNSDNQTDTLTNSFTYVHPTITTIVPNNDYPAGGATVTITGTDFTPETYRRAVTIDNSSGPLLTDYQIPVIFDSQALITAGKMRRDAGDIRFYDTDGTTPINNYWLEGPLDNSSTTKVWVKVPTIPAASTKTIYLSYGDFSLTSLSDANNTFIDVIENDLRANWTFDESSGTADLADQSGYENNGLMSGTNASTNVITGIYGNARTFNGTDNFVDVDHASNLNINNGLTIESWVYLTATPSFNSGVLTKACSNQFSPTRGFYSLLLNDFGSYFNKPYLKLGDGSNTRNVGSTGADPALSENAWHHLVATYDSTTGTGKFYIDGVAKETNTSMTASAILNNTDNLNIGRCTAGNYFTGRIDETKLYRRALTAGEITDLYNNYGYSTPEYLGSVLIKQFTSTEPGVTLGAETGTIPVTFNGVPATVTDATRTSITVTAPANPAGTYPVVVTNLDGDTATTNFIYGVPPTITPPLSPDFGNIAGGTVVTINGSDFVSGATVTFDGIASPNVTFVNSTQLTAETPAHPTVGLVDVVVTNPNTQSDTLIDGFTYESATDANASTVTANPTTGVEADGVETSVVTVLLQDATLNPIYNKVVTLAQIDQPIGGTLTISAQNCPLPEPAGPAPGTSNINGKACFNVKTSPNSSAGVVGTYEVEATDQTSSITIVDTATIDFVSLITDEDDSTVTAPVGNVIADGIDTKTITATIRNKNGVAIQGKNVSLAQESGPAAATINTLSGTTNALGEATFSVSTTVSGSYVFRATETSSSIILVNDDVTVNFIAGATDPNAPASTVIAVPTTVLSNGLDSSTVTVTLRDSLNNPVVSKNVSLVQISGPGSLTITSGINPTNSSGIATFTVKTTVAGTYSVEATNTSESVTLTQTPSITFTPPTAGDSTVTANPTTVISDGSSTSTVTVTLKDASNNLFANKTVTLAQISGSGTPTITAGDCPNPEPAGALPGTTNINGKACFTVSSGDPGLKTYQASNTSDSQTITQTADITFGGGQAWAANGKVIANGKRDVSTYLLPDQNQAIRTSDNNYIVGWVDENGVHAQKYNSTGTPQWSVPNGITLTTEIGDELRVIPDDTGAIFTWLETDGLTGYISINGQKVNSAGTPQWNAGTPIEFVTRIEAYPSIYGYSYKVISDNSNGLFMFYVDANDTTFYGAKPKLTRIDSNGATYAGGNYVWPQVVPNDGVHLCHRYVADISSPDAGVVRIAWIYSYGTGCNFSFQKENLVDITTYDDVNLSSPYALRAFILSSDNAVPDPDPDFQQDYGSGCPVDADQQSSPRIIEEPNTDSVYVLFKELCVDDPLADQRPHIFLNFIPNDNFTDFNHFQAQWSINLGATSGTIYEPYSTQIISDQDGGVIVYWNDVHNNTSTGNLQRIRDLDVGADHEPEVLWNGGDALPYYITNMTEGPIGGVNFVWGGTQINDPNGYPGAFGYTTRLWGLQLDSSGLVAAGWDPNGTQVSDDPITTQPPSNYPYWNEYPYQDAENRTYTITPDGSDGMVVPWVKTGIPYYEQIDTDNFIQRMSNAGAQLFDSGNEVEITPNADTSTLSEQTQTNAHAVQTSSNQTIVAWMDDWNPIEEGLRINAEKLDANGDPLWNPSAPGLGVLASRTDNTTTTHDSPSIAADDNSGYTGGLLLAYRRDDNYVHAQKLNNDGTANTTWDASGLGKQLNNGFNFVNENEIQIISDRQGGAFVVWAENTDIYGQHLLGTDGSNLWGSNQLTSFVTDNKPQVIYNSSNELFIIFERGGASTDIYIMKVNPNTGSITNGPLTITNTLTDGGQNQKLGEITTDSSGNVMVTYRDDTSGLVYAQKINHTNLSQVWGSSGVIVSPLTNTNDQNPQIASDNNDGILIAYEKWDGGNTASDIAIQRLDTNGVKLWNDDILITDSSDIVIKTNLDLISDTVRGMTLTWEKWNIAQTEKHIYSQHIVNTIHQWPQYGEQLSNLPTRADTHPILGNKNLGSGVVTWDGKSSPPDIYGQYIFEENRSNNSTFTTDLNLVSGDGVSFATLTATLLDSGDNPIPNKDFQIDVINGNPATPTITAIDCPLPEPAGTSPGTTNTNGKACFTISSPSNGDFTLTATDITDNNLTLTPTVDISFDSVTSAATSTVIANPTSVIGNGVEYSTITVALKDGASVPITSRPVDLIKLSGPGTPTILPVNCDQTDVHIVTPGTTNSLGEACFQVTSTTVSATPVTFQAADPAVPVTITQTADVTFTTGPISVLNSTAVANPNPTPADGVSETTVTATVRDTTNNLIPNLTLSLNQSGPGLATLNTIDDSTSGTTDIPSDDGNTGEATFTASTTTSGDYNFSPYLASGSSLDSSNTTIEDTNIINKFNGSYAPADLIPGSQNDGSTPVTTTLPFDIQVPITPSIPTGIIPAGTNIYMCSKGSISFVSTGFCTNTGFSENSIVGASTNARSDGFAIADEGIYKIVSADNNSVRFLWRVEHSIAGTPNIFEMVIYRDSSYEFHYFDLDIVTRIGKWVNFAYTASSLPLVGINQQATRYEIPEVVGPVTFNPAPATFTAGAVVDGNSTVDAFPFQVPANDVDFSLVSVTLRDSFNNGVPGILVELNDDDDLPSDVNYTPVNRRAITDASGIANFEVRSPVRDTYTFSATVDPDGTPLTLTDTATVEFTCDVNGNQQCLQVNVQNGAGNLLFAEVPDNFTFPNITSSNQNEDRFSADAVNYDPNQEALLSIEDTEQNTGFLVQLQSSAFTAGANSIPLNNLYVATSPSSTGGTYNACGVEWSYLNPGVSDVEAVYNTTGPLNSATTFLTDGTNLTAPIDLLRGGLPAPDGHNGTFSANVDYYAKIPAFQPTGNYQVTLTFDLTDSTDIVPAC